MVTHGTRDELTYVSLAFFSINTSSELILILFAAQCRISFAKHLRSVRICKERSPAIVAIVSGFLRIHSLGQFPRYLVWPALDPLLSKHHTEA